MLIIVQIFTCFKQASLDVFIGFSDLLFKFIIQSNLKGLISTLFLSVILIFIHCYFQNHHNSS